MVGQYDEGLIRPLRLTVDPVLKNEQHCCRTAPPPPRSRPQWCAQDSPPIPAPCRRSPPPVGRPFRLTRQQRQHHVRRALGLMLRLFCASTPAIGIPRHQRCLFAVYTRRTAENAAKALERRAYGDALVTEFEFTDRMFVIAASFLHDGQCAPHAAIELIATGRFAPEAVLVPFRPPDHP